MGSIIQRWNKNQTWRRELETSLGTGLPAGLSRCGECPACCCCCPNPLLLMSIILGMWWREEGPWPFGVRRVGGPPPSVLKAELPLALVSPWRPNPWCRPCPVKVDNLKVEMGNKTMSRHFWIVCKKSINYYLRSKWVKYIALTTDWLKLIIYQIDFLSHPVQSIQRKFQQQVPIKEILH